MTDKAFITKRGADRNKDTEALENKTAQKFGFRVDKNFSRGTLISVDDPGMLRNLEAEGYRVKLYRDPNILEVGLSRIDIEEGLPDIPLQLQIPESLKDTWTHYIVHCKSPPSISMVREIEEEGIDVVEIMSQKAIFVVCKAEDINKISNLPFVARILPFQPAYRLDKKLLEFKGNIQDVLIDIYPPGDLESVKDAIRHVNGKIIADLMPQDPQKTYAKLIIEINSEHIYTLARLPSVRRVEYREPKPSLDGEREAQILAHQLENGNPVPGYQRWLSEIELSGRGVTIAICDSGIDLNLNNNEAGHPDLRGRQTAFVDYTNGTDKTDTNGHGTHVAGICVGNAETRLREGSNSNGFLWGQGIAPNAKYVNLNLLSNKNSRGEDDYTRLIRNVVSNGAQIMNNSWGSQLPDTSYNDDAKTIDGLCRDPNRSSSNEDIIIVFSSGNKGPEPETLTSPHAVKNPIVVGNSLTFHDPFSNTYRGINESSSRGLTSDGRIKPDIVAPGTYVSSAWTRTGNAERWGNNFVPGTQNLYMYGTGTSMAAPHISGCCALLVEWWRKRTNGKNPSLALLKAILIISGEDLEGGQSGRPDVSGKLIPLKNIPNRDQGWGLVDLSRILMPNNIKYMIFSDQRHPFTSSYQEHSIKVTPIDENQELRITLAWTDPPGEIGATSALVNDLDLEVFEDVSQQIYKGNVFDKGYSTTGGQYDQTNNVECVYIKNPKGSYQVRIIATVAANALPPFNKVPWQDYALVLYNAKPIENSSEGISLD